MRITKADYKKLWDENQKLEKALRDCSLMVANLVDYVAKVHGEETAKQLLKIDGGVEA